MFAQLRCHEEAPWLANGGANACTTWCLTNGGHCVWGVALPGLWQLRQVLGSIYWEVPIAMDLLWPPVVPTMMMPLAMCIMFAAPCATSSHHAQRNKFSFKNCLFTQQLACVTTIYTLSPVDSDTGMAVEGGRQSWRHIVQLNVKI